jgi:hypothetical protein
MCSVLCMYYVRLILSSSGHGLGMNECGKMWDTTFCRPEIFKNRMESKESKDAKTLELACYQSNIASCMLIPA